MSYCTCKAKQRYPYKFVKVPTVDGICTYCNHYAISEPLPIVRKRKIDIDREDLYDTTVLSYLTAMKELKNGN